MSKSISKKNYKHVEEVKNKSCIHESLNLLICADSSTDTKTDRREEEGRRK